MNTTKAEVPHRSWPIWPLLTPFLPRTLARLTALSCTAIAPCSLVAEEFHWTQPAGEWDLTSLIWKNSSNALIRWPEFGADNDALLEISGSITLAVPILINDVRLSEKLTLAIKGAHALSLGGTVQSEIDVAAGAELTITSNLAGNSGFLKTGSGRLIITNPLSALSGAIKLANGTLEIGLSSNLAAVSPLRSSSVDLANGTSLNSLGSSNSSRDLRIGSLAGSGSVGAGPGTLFQLLLGDSTFNGKITAGGVNLRGPGSQRFEGDLSGVTGTLTLHNGADLTIAGLGSFNGVMGTTAIHLRGGSLTIENLGGNSASASGRVNATVASYGGELSLVGSPTGSVEGVGELALSAGETEVHAIHLPTSAGLTHFLFNSIIRPNVSTATVNFSSGDSAFSTSGVGTRISFSSAPEIQAVNSGGRLLGNSIAWGYATVNGMDFATVSGSNNIIVPITPEPFPSVGSTTKNALLVGSGTTNASATSFALNSLTIAPTAANQSLKINGAGNLNVSAFLLRGSISFTIESSPSGGGISGTATRIFHIPHRGATLTITAPLTDSLGKGVIKAGDGTLALLANNRAATGTTTINGGTIRVSPAGLPSGALQLRGGVLEITGGQEGLGASADFTRPLGNISGRVNWSIQVNSTITETGSGGFAAFGSNATVSIGGGTPSTLTWESTDFLRDGQVLLLNSENADHRITLLNGIDLTSTSAGNYSAREVRVAKNPFSAGDLARISGTIVGTGNTDLLKTGDGMLQLTGNNTYSGNTIIQRGILEVGASDGAGAGDGALGATGKIIVRTGAVLVLGGTTNTTDRINDSAEIVLEGGTFGTRGLSEYSADDRGIEHGLGTLTLGGDSIIDLASTGTLAFEDSSRNIWRGTLLVHNWNNSAAGGSRLFFGTTSTGLRLDQLSQMLFYSDAGKTLLGSAQSGEAGAIVPVPEPSCAVFGLGLLGLLRLRRRRR